MNEQTEGAVLDALNEIAGRAKFLTVGARDLETEELTEEEAHNLTLLAGMFLLERIGAVEIEEGLLP